MGAASWSEEEMDVRREGPSWVRFFMKGRDYLNSSQSGRIGSSLCFLASLDSFPCSPPPCVHACMVCGQLEIEDLVGLPPCWCRDGSAHRDIRGGIDPVGRDLIATRVAVATRFRVAIGSAVATPCPVAIRLSRCPPPSRWCRNGLGGRDSACVAFGVPLGPIVCRRMPQGRLCP
ncbi:hypothetical protein Taro_024696 [Colocasia esculenta]|uniref:Uncharacterized protein n=1 Tax=Colocasia esculenta TaxID=4460 RepID=A0A843VL49_COLES|nr:hypothetical protein [Colocasia esculenta]